VSSAACDEALVAIEACAEATARMLDAAAADDWEGVEALETQRRGLLSAIRSASSGPPSEARLVAMRALVAADVRLAELAGAAQVGRLNALRQARRATSGSATYRRLGFATLA